MNDHHPGDLPSTPPPPAPPSAPSSGPRTPAGKAISSQNARKHDLCSRTLRLSPDEWAEYNDMRARYGRDLQPAGDLEETLIDEICFNYWRLQQARDAELGIIDRHSTALPLIALYIRYRTGYERGFYKALDKLHHAQRLRKQNGKLAEVPPAAVRSAEAESSNQAAVLAGQLEDHLLENRVRGELALPPLEVPEVLLGRLKAFVSQNPAAVPDRLLELMRKAA
jgi:hypothetical protein